MKIYPQTQQSLCIRVVFYPFVALIRSSLVITIAVSLFCLSGCSKEKKISSVPQYLIGDWVAINFPYDDFPDVKNNYLDEDVTKVKIRADKYFDGRVWIPIDLTRLTVKGGNEFTFYDKSKKNNDGWNVTFLDDPSNNFKRYKGSIHVYDFMSRGDERHENWLEVGYFKRQ